MIETFFNKGYQAYHKGLSIHSGSMTLSQRLEFQNGWLYAKANDKRKDKENDRHKVHQG